MVARLTLTLSLLSLLFLVGCQQRMATQPAPRPYEEYAAFPSGQSSQPLVAGVVYRGQRSPDDPVISWLTSAGKAPKPTPEWKNLVDKDGQSAPPPGAPTDVENFVKEFPFKLTEKDLKAGQTLYNIHCGVCHGATGQGNGKIVERGYLRPPSYHVDPNGEAKDWGIQPAERLPEADRAALELPQGYSRGFGRFRKLVPINEVPVGYIYQVITWGFGGMPDLASQIKPEDRWRIIAYIRALQLSQGAKIAELPPETKKAAESALSQSAGVKKKADH